MRLEDLLQYCPHSALPSTLQYILTVSLFFIDKAFFEEEGLNGDDFTLLTRVSSWAICGGVSEERVAIGRQCKRLIDYGRLQVLQKDGYDVRLAQYTSREVTPENIVLIASRTKRVDTPL